eukprot:scaffold8892_cov107-Isochrysis_galbana.AAC.2
MPRRDPCFIFALGLAPDGWGEQRVVASGDAVTVVTRYCAYRKAGWTAVGTRLLVRCAAAPRERRHVRITFGTKTVGVGQQGLGHVDPSFVRFRNAAMQRAHAQYINQSYIMPLKFIAVPVSRESTLSNFNFTALQSTDTYLALLYYNAYLTQNIFNTSIDAGSSRRLPAPHSCVTSRRRPTCGEYV